MNNFTYHSKDTATTDASGTLDILEKNIGFIPNIFAVIAESSVALSGLVGLNEQFSKSAFTQQEQQVILMATSVENECAYCVAGHSAFAHQLGMPQDIITALRQHKDTGNPRYDALANTVRQLVIHRGRIPASIVQHFVNSGFNNAQFLELVMGICVKTFTNYVSNALSVALDDAFSPFVWQRPTAQMQNIA